MADHSTQLIVDALSKAMAEPAGTPLHRTKNTPGLFAASGAGKQAAQRCKDDGLLRVVHTESNGKSDGEVYSLTEKGLAFLLGQVSPKQVLEDLVRAVESRQIQLQELLGIVRQTQANLDGLKTIAEKVLGELRLNRPGAAVSANGKGTHAPIVNAPGTSALLAQLGQWQAAGASEDCPLPELFRRVQQTLPTLTIGQFHDQLRSLYDQTQVYLHPWTGPLHDMPEPPYSMLVGHEIAYYASLRS